MTSLQKKLTGFVLAPRAGFIWLALVGFFLGSAFCAFNLPEDERPHSMKIEGTMNSLSESRINSENMRLSGSASASSEMETATFAMG